LTGQPFGAAEACGVYRHALGRHLSQLDLNDRVGRRNYHSNSCTPSKHTSSVPGLSFALW